MLYLECAEQFLRLPNCQVSCSTAMAMCVWFCVICALRKLAILRLKWT